MPNPFETSPSGNAAADGTAPARPARPKMTPEATLGTALLAYAGANGVKDALLGGESEVRSSLHLVTTQVDGGPILLISEPVAVDKNSGMSLEEASRFYLKPLNDMTRKLFPRVVKDIAEGTYRRDDKGLLYYGDTPIPKGVRL